MEQWLFDLGVNQKLEDLGISEEDVDKFCDLAEQTPSLGLLLSVAPVQGSRERIARIYRNSLHPLE